MLAFAVVMVSSSSTQMPDALPKVSIESPQYTTPATTTQTQPTFLSSTNPDQKWYEPIILTEIIYASIAILFMFTVTYCLNINTLYRHGSILNPIIIIFIIALGLCIYILIPGRGHTMNQSTRWIRFGEFGFQPSEIAKWAMVGLIAWWGARSAGNIRQFKSGFLPAMLIILVTCGIIASQDLGTAVLIGAVSLGIIIAAGARWKHVFLMMAGGIALIIPLIVLFPYRMARLTSYWNPYADPKGSGYQLIESLVAISEGKLAGRGLGNGIQKFQYLPEDTTDFIFSTICGELGLAGAIFVLGMYFLMIFTSFCIIRDCRNKFARLLAFGIMLTIGLQALINTAVVTGLLPTKGIALPLLSHGGTGWVMTAIAIGVLASIDRMTRLGHDSPVTAQSQALQYTPNAVSVSAMNY